MVARDRTARARIRQYLATAGPLEEGSGHATSALKEIIDYQGSSVAFIQLIAAMDRDGEIDREIRGKRTYRISAAGDASLAGSGASLNGRALGRIAAATTTGGTATVEIDYNRLAKALVGELLEFVAGNPAPAVAESDERLIAERDEYARRLRIAREKIDELLGAEVDMPTMTTVAGAV